MSARVVSIHYTLKNGSGETLDSSREAEPLTYLEGVGQIIPGLENILKAMSTGDSKNVVIPAKDAYGSRDEKLVIQLERSQLPQNEGIQIGDVFRSDAHGGESYFVVTKLSDTHVTIDGNHPLAGEELHFDVEVMNTREATAEELQHGHAHGVGGHHHH